MRLAKPQNKFFVALFSLSIFTLRRECESGALAANSDVFLLSRPGTPETRAILKSRYNGVKLFSI